METAPLKSFATWARTVLIREVSARISIVLASLEMRQEQPKAVAALERAVKEAGGGYEGRDTMADKVAYTWFNRIIALRFMDANGYTGVGVVSPEHDRAGGQPEILADANRGNIDPEIVRPAIAHTVTGLLNGTRRSADSLGEAYALLLAEYCRHWNRAMPFMFEPEGDYTELLIPSNLLADDSVLARAQAVLGEEVCRDVEVIGWLYQFYILEKKDEVFAGFKKGKKAGAAEIPAATQLFTPHWIVRYLVENSLGRLWVLNRPTSRLADQMDYYVKPVDTEIDYLKVGGPEELRIMDPACGSGHMLTYAFDLLYAIYEEEGYAPSEIPGLILTHNLYGTEIDPRAGALAAFALTMKARQRQRTFFSKQVEPRICVLEPVSFTPPELDMLISREGDRREEETFWNQFQHADTFGSLICPREDLIEPLRYHLDTNVSEDGDLFTHELQMRARRVTVQAEYLQSRYHVVVANPPYMGSGNMAANLSSWLKDVYPEEKQDLYGCFVSRGTRLVGTGGLIAMITGDTWMTIKSFEGFRKRLLKRHTILDFMHLRDVSNHPDIFGANTAFVLSKGHIPQQICRFVYLQPLKSEAKRKIMLEATQNPHSPSAFHARSDQFESIPGSPIVYRMSESIRDAFKVGRFLDSITQGRQGLITADTNRFVRRWFEIDVHKFANPAHESNFANSDKKWFALNSGGDYRKWYGNQEFVVNWHNDGSEIREFRDASGRQRSRPQNVQHYFQPAVSWSAITSSLPAFRYYPEGFIFDNAGMSAFVPANERLKVLGLLNSVVARDILGALSPTLNLNAGTIGDIPLPRAIPDEVDEVVGALVSISRDDWQSTELSWDFAVDAVIKARCSSRIADAFARHYEESARITTDFAELEQANDLLIATAFGVENEVQMDVDISRISLHGNPAYKFSAGKSQQDLRNLFYIETAKAFVSYAVGCIFGRYSLDEPGLILANQGDTLQEYLAEVPNPSFAPDADNVIPLVGGDWFEDDIVERFREFLRVAFGEEHFEENLRFVTEFLGVKELRDYFVKSFYKDHLLRYKKRPIYWLFSSPKGSFNALVYMHRYTPSTVSTVLNEYLREYTAKLEASRQQQVRLVAAGGTPREMAAAQKEVDRLRKVLLELEEYEHDVLHPLAQQQVHLDLDDGVKANYPKLGAALKKIPGLEATNE